MADTAQFDHDRLGHLLSDRLLQVPRFQRSYSWEQSNVEEYLSDLSTAREKNGPYFMGTVVFAQDSKDPDRHLIVDGQQRLATTAVLLCAIRDLLREYKKDEQANHINKTYLRGYDLVSEEYVDRLMLNPDDQPAYGKILSSAEFDESSDLTTAYKACREHLSHVAPTEDDYKALVEITQQLDHRVQVLVAVATDLPEAYVIFETLNDRGADLTTADLLKNYLFSQAKSNFDYVETTWIRISSAFEKSENLVKLIRHEHASRRGKVTTRKLYRAIQKDIGEGSSSTKKYIERLDKVREYYIAIHEPDHSKWNALDFDVRDSLLAFRRFQFESSLPLLLAAFGKWDERDAAKLLIKVANWSVRAQFVGRIGGSVADEVFGEAARKVSTGEAKNQDEVREALSRIVPGDQEFRRAFASYGNLSVNRAKYLLAMLEQAKREKAKLPSVNNDWSSKAVTIEHVHAKSKQGSSSELGASVNHLGNLTLLEKGKNRNLEDKDFSEKSETYKTSVFDLTKELGGLSEWDAAALQARTDQLAGLAVLAWPGK